MSPSQRMAWVCARPWLSRSSGLLEGVLPAAGGAMRRLLRSFPTRTVLGFRDFINRAEFRVTPARSFGDQRVTTERSCDPEPWGVGAAEVPEGFVGLSGLRGAGDSRRGRRRSHTIPAPLRGAVPLLRGHCRAVTSVSPCVPGTGTRRSGAAVALGRHAGTVDCLSPPSPCPFLCLAPSPQPGGWHRAAPPLSLPLSPRDVLGVQRLCPPLPGVPAALAVPPGLAAA